MVNTIVATAAVDVRQGIYTKFTVALRSTLQLTLLLFSLTFLELLLHAGGHAEKVGLTWRDQRWPAI